MKVSALPDLNNVATENGNLEILHEIKQTPILLDSRWTGIEEVQHLSSSPSTSNSSIDTFQIAASDSKGRTAIYQLHDPESNNSSSAEDFQLSFVLNPPRPTERGWTGAALHPTEGAAKVVSTHHFGRWLCSYQDGQVAQVLHTAGNPTTVKYVQLPNCSAPLISTTEHSQVNNVKAKPEIA